LRRETTYEENPNDNVQHDPWVIINAQFLHWITWERFTLLNHDMPNGIPVYPQ
jgi:hypothetical protein